MNLGEREAGLLRLVEDYREQECRRILEAARQEAAASVRQSFREHRARLHSRVVAERAGARSRIQAARAEQATRERWSSERWNLELLRVARPLLRERLLGRWQRPEPRRHWVETYLRCALDRLPHGSWTVRHASDWPEPERNQARAVLTAALGREPGLLSDDGVEAGLIVKSGGAVLDASLQGLLQDQARLDARLLALIATGADR